MQEQVDLGMLLCQSADLGRKSSENCRARSGPAITPGHRHLPVTYKDICVLRIGLPNQWTLAGKNVAVWICRAGGWIGRPIQRQESQPSEKVEIRLFGEARQIDRRHRAGVVDDSGNRGKRSRGVPGISASDRLSL